VAGCPRAIDCASLNPLHIRLANVATFLRGRRRHIDRGLGRPGSMRAMRRRAHAEHRRRRVEEPGVNDARAGRDQRDRRQRVGSIRQVNRLEREVHGVDLAKEPRGIAQSRQLESASRRAGPDRRPSRPRAARAPRANPAGASRRSRPSNARATIDPTARAAPGAWPASPHRGAASAPRGLPVRCRRGAPRCSRRADR